MSAHTPGPWVVFTANSQGRANFTILPAGRPGEIADRIANTHDASLIAAAPEMLAALKNVRKIISEAAITGFNWKDGDWAEWLFESQQVTSAAISKATSGSR